MSEWTSYFLVGIVTGMSIVLLPFIFIVGYAFVEDWLRARATTGSDGEAQDGSTSTARATKAEVR